jgi:hypothetical protein
MPGIVTRKTCRPEDNGDGREEGAVPQWRDFLERFRPAGTPGAAARPGVPADRSADAAAELTPLLVLLDDTQDEAQRIRREAADRAEEIRRAAQRQANQIVARARAEAEVVRAQTEAKARTAAAAAWSEMRAETAAEIERVQARVADRMPRYVDDVVALAREWLAQSPQAPTVGTES